MARLNQILSKLRALTKHKPRDEVLTLIGQLAQICEELERGLHDLDREQQALRVRIEAAEAKLTQSN